MNIIVYSDFMGSAAHAFIFLCFKFTALILGAAVAQCVEKSLNPSQYQLLVPLSSVEGSLAGGQNLQLANSNSSCLRLNKGICQVK